MAKIFISYANAEAGFAEALKNALSELGHTLWWFEEGIAPGQKLQETIFDQLRNADALLILVSPSSLRSQWVGHELGAALAYSEERGKPLIIPVLLGGVVLEPPLSRYMGIRADSSDAEEVALKVSVSFEEQFGRVRAKEEERREVQKKWR
jgi:hypothetical protein